MVKVDLKARKGRMVGLATFFALAIGACAGVLVLHRYYSERLNSESKERLIGLVKTVASTIDVQAHESLTDPGQAGSEAYLKLDRQLASVLQSNREIKFLYTIRRTGTDYAFVLDPTPAGDSDADGVDDKSYLLDPYDEINDLAKSVFETGQASADPNITTDRWGTFLSAYAPLRDARGKVVAIVGADITAETILKDRRNADRSALIALAFGLIGALAATLAVMRSPT
jgi:hypothetical protein